MNGVEDVRLRCAVRSGATVDMQASGSFQIHENLLGGPWLVQPREPGTTMVRITSEEDLEAVRERRLAFPRPNMHVLLSEALRGDMDAILEVREEKVLRMVLLARPVRWWKRLGQTMMIL